MRTPFAALLIMLASASFAHAQAGACPSQEFEPYLDAYTDSEDLQKQFTRFPLTVQFVVENAQVAQEPIKVSASVEREQAVYPLMPDAEQLKDDAFVRTISGEGNARHVHYEKPETDMVFDLHFVKTRGCWQLTEKDDGSR